MGKKNVSKPKVKATKPTKVKAAPLEVKLKPAPLEVRLKSPTAPTLPPPPTRPQSPPTKTHDSQTPSRVSPRLAKMRSRIMALEIKLNQLSPQERKPSSQPPIFLKKLSKLLGQWFNQVLLQTHHPLDYFGPKGARFTSNKPVFESLIAELSLADAHAEHVFQDTDGKEKKVFSVASDRICSHRSKMKKGWANGCATIHRCITLAEDGKLNQIQNTNDLLEAFQTITDTLLSADFPLVFMSERAAKRLVSAMIATVQMPDFGSVRSRLT